MGRAAVAHQQEQTGWGLHLKTNYSLRQVTSQSYLWNGNCSSAPASLADCWEDQRRWHKWKNFVSREAQTFAFGPHWSTGSRHLGEGSLRRRQSSRRLGAVWLQAWSQAHTPCVLPSICASYLQMLSIPLLINWTLWSVFCLLVEQISEFIYLQTGFTAQVTHA